MYAYLVNETFTFVGFPNGDQHLINCNFCQTSSLSTGLEAAQRLVATAQLNADSPAVVAGADSTVEGQAEQLFASDPAGGTSGVGYEIFASGQPDKAFCTHGFYSEGVGRLGAITTGVVKHTGGHSGETTGIRYLLSKFTDINAMTKAQSMLICWSRRQPISDIRIRLESWLKIVSQSQGLFPPNNITQMLP